MCVKLVDWILHLGEHDQLEMRELHDSLADLHVTARRVSRSINGDKKKKGN